MFEQKLKIGIGAASVAIALAVAPVAPAWASAQKKHHKTHHSSKSKGKSKAATSSKATCPPAATFTAAASTTYTAPTSQPGAGKGWLVCTYKSGGSPALLVSFYTKGDSLRSISGNVPAATTPISGIGNAASYYGTEVYVQRDSAQSFSVIDQTGNLSLTQTEAEAKAIANG